MKELALIGSSNAICGYGPIIKQRINCDVFALGSTTSIFAVFTLLQHNIIGNYKYVILETNINEIMAVNTNDLNTESIVANLSFIISQFRESKSILVFLIMGRLSWEVHQSTSYIYRALGRIFGIPVIDIEGDLNLIDNDKLAKDSCHLYPLYQNYIVDTIIKTIKNLKKSEYDRECELEFSLLNMSDIPGIKSCIKGTSLLSRKVHMLDPSQRIYLPEPSYFCGIYYWIDTISPLLQFNNQSITLVKNLNISNFHHLFMCRSCGYSVYHGLKGGYISQAVDMKNKCIERTLASMERSGSHQYLFICDILVSSMPPVMEGARLYNKYRRIFAEEQFNLAKMYMEKIDYERTSYFAWLDKQMPSSKIFFKHILEQRPDICAKIHEWKNPGASLLFWVWRYGRHELKLDLALMADMEFALKKLARTKHPDSNVKGYSLLIHALWETREDLERFSPLTEDGQKNILHWFLNNGIREYDLEPIIPDNFT